jgi:hypothetical protein
VSTPEAPQPGPCTPWITGEDVAAVCEALEASDIAIYDDVALVAGNALYELSGRRFSGECGPVTVRPCDPHSRCSPDPCGCCELSEVMLSGYPIREVTEVKIDGTVIDTTEYRLDARQRLVRVADADGKRQRWPGCQRLDRDDTEEDTFSVTYTFGQDPPQLGLDAAQALACQLAYATPAASGECELPDGTVRVTRQGVTIDLEEFSRVGVLLLPTVALFLEVYNPSRLRRRSAVWSPDLQPFARRVG